MPTIDPRMRWCPACEQYVMPQVTGVRVGWGGPVVLIVAVLAALGGGAAGKAVAVPIIGVAVLGLGILGILRLFARLSGRGTCPMCKGPVSTARPT